jgi:hypothetical protein
VHTRFSWEHLRERDYLEDPGVDGRIILKWFFSMGYGLDLSQDRDGWRALVNAVMNLWDQ